MSGYSNTTHLKPVLRAKRHCNKIEEGFENDPDTFGMLYTAPTWLVSIDSEETKGNRARPSIMPSQHL